MFSARTNWQLAPNPLDQARVQRLRDGRPFVDLTVSNPTVAGLTWPDRDGLAAALSQPEVLEYAPEPFGRPDARAALSSWLSRRGLPLPASQLCLTASTSEAYALLFKLLCDPGDAVLCPTPSYPLFEYLAGLEGVTLRPYQLRYDGSWHIDRASFEAAVKGVSVRAVITIHPNNPTGHYLTTDELGFLTAQCAANDLALLSDEVFYEHGLQSARDLAPRAASQARCLTFSLGGLSKLAGLPQLKLGWIAANGPQALLAPALARLEVIADSYLSVGAPVQLALPYILRGVDAFLGLVDERLRRNLAALDATLRSVPSVTRFRCEAGWSAILRLPHTQSSEAWAIALLEVGVLVQPGYFYELTPDAHVVVSLLCAEAEFSAGVGALAAGTGTAAG